MANKKAIFPFGKVILFLYIIGYLLLSVLPMVKYSVTYLVSGLYSLTFIAYHFVKSDDKEKLFFVLVVMVAFGVFQGLIAYLNENAEISALVNEPIRVLRTLVPCFIFAEVLGSSKKTQVVLWLTITILFLYVSVTTLVNLAIDDMIARKLASGSHDEVLSEYRMQNVGGFEIAYSLGLALPLLFMLFFHSRNFIGKLLCLGFVGYIFYYVMATQYFILLLLAVLSVFIWIIFGSVRPQVKILVISIFFLFVFLASPVLRWMADWNVGALLKKRLISIADVLDGKSDIGDTSVRLELYKNAFITLLYNPLGQYRSVASYKSHSLVLGTSSSVGIIGLLFLTVEFIVYYKSVKKSLVKFRISAEPFNICYILYVILAFVNPIGYCYELAIIVFFYVPLTTLLFIKNDNRQRLYNLKRNWSKTL